MAAFSKVLSRIDVEKRLSIPTMYFKKYIFPHFEGQQQIDLEVRDGEGEVWVLGCYVRTRGHFKPVLSRGWRKFIKAKGLKPGDKLTIYMEKGQGNSSRVQCRIIATKTIKLFGVYVDAYVL